LIAPVATTIKGITERTNTKIEPKKKNQRGHGDIVRRIAKPRRPG